VVQFDGALTLTYHATQLILPGNVDIVTAAGDIAEFISLGAGNWVCTNYQRDTTEVPPLSGTWTPVLMDSSLSDSEGQTYTVQEGIYTRIGDIIFISCYLQVSGTGTLTGSDPAYIGGLPVAARAGISAPGGMQFTQSSLLTVSLDVIGGTMGANNTYMTMEQWASSGTSDLVINHFAGGTGLLVGHGHYFV